MWHRLTQAALVTNVDDEIAQAVARYGWYHTIDLGDGVVTPGMFDHRPVVDRYMLPESLEGMRCLDVGTMDGFWAFEMERRGAAEVVATDVGAVDELDWPRQWRERIQPALDETKAERFALVSGARGSSANRIERSVYELDPAEIGLFDLVFCGDLLVHLKDPITAVQRILGVCRGSAIVCNPAKRFPFARRRALAEFDGIDQFRWWLLSEASIERMLLAAGFDRIEVGRRFELPPTDGGPWRGLRCVMRGHVR
ncbi:MAG TPA: methyltransferase domain-containing protein [Solirubrobacteraceae bacterium]